MECHDPGLIKNNDAIWAGKTGSAIQPFRVTIHADDNVTRTMFPFRFGAK
jgi:hypothetical protein